MLRVVLILPAFTLVAISLVAALVIAGKIRPRARGKVASFFGRVFCAMLDVRVKSVGTPPRDNAVLIVSNHVSWVDIIAIASAAPVIFIAKSEVAGWPVIGWATTALGSVFVDRSRRQLTQQVNADIAQRLAEGHSIVLFAEGTSSDGNRVLPFRSALVGALREALTQAGPGQRVAVQPLSVAYTGVLGLPMGRQHRPIVAWYGDRELFPHLLELVRRGGIDVTLSWGTPVAYDGGDRKVLVRSLEATVRTMTAASLRGRPTARPAVGGNSQPATGDAGPVPNAS